jgi:glutaconyl-CoA/methylmalonyl-CoA decarboxylase subunit gamma
VKRLRITVNGISYDVEVEVLEEDEPTNFPNNASPHPVMPNLPSPPQSQQSQPAAKPAPAAQPSQAPANGARTLTSPISGIVAEVRVSPGTQVQENDPVIVLEAMKMNTNVSSPIAGKVKAILVKAGESVSQGQVLLEYE